MAFRKEHPSAPSALYALNLLRGFEFAAARLLRRPAADRSSGGSYKLKLAEVNNRRLMSVRTSSASGKGGAVRRRRPQLLLLRLCCSAAADPAAPLAQNRTRGQKYQNRFAYKHNKSSKKTQAILAIPIGGVCSRCATRSAPLRPAAETLPRAGATMC